MKLKKIIVISLLSITLGFLTSNIIIGNFNVPLSSDPTLLNNINNPGVLFFFKHNLSFFLTMTVLPLINIPIFIFQLIMTGVHINIIGELSFANQFNILFRHLFFEYIALVISVVVSFKNYIVLKDLHQNKINTLSINLKKIFILYTFIIILTIIAARLEGNFQ